MPRESIARIARLLDDVDEHAKQRTSRPAAKRSWVARQPTALAYSFVNLERWQVLRYVFTRRFELAMGGDILVTLPCSRRHSAEADEYLIPAPSVDTRIFWFVRRPPVAAFAIRLSEVQVLDPGVAYRCIGKVVDRKLAETLWPQDGPPRRSPL